MNKFHILGICLAAFLIPCVVVLAMNPERVVREDRTIGNLLYFRGG